jgi:hypothetical protein
VSMAKSCGKGGSPKDMFAMKYVLFLLSGIIPDRKSSSSDSVLVVVALARGPAAPLPLSRQNVRLSFQWQIQRCNGE